ncbi:hypothetical protein GQ54DRAFT_308647 [Martensiomyces pterosporus]|nr:hypothetical protein GQ54DRAFT_308647 [Martensiomyces pterosporus]
MPLRSQTEYIGAGGPTANAALLKDEQQRPRGLRARFRQRRARNGSEDEVRSRPRSLDLTQSLTSLPTAHEYTAAASTARADAQDDDDGGDNGLALGEFGVDGDEVVEDEGYRGASGNAGDARAVPSGAIVRAHSEESDQAGSDNAGNRGSVVRKTRRESTQSVPSYDSAAHRAPTNDKGSIHETSEDYGSGSEDGTQSGNYSYEYDYGGEEGDEGVNGGDFDADGELNAVYLKRNADFHTLFRSIPINELLIDDYGCALQRDILVQGRLYLTENFVCFYSNIFGWVTNLVIGIDEVVSIEKKMTALIIPNAIQISTLHAKHFFGSFIYRDSAYNQLIDLWGKSRNEKSAGFPEIGHAEGGDGAGDVSRHRGDVLTAYQSLSEDEDGSGSESDGYGSDKASVGGGSGNTTGGSLSDTESESEEPGNIRRSGSDSHASTASKQTHSDSSSTGRHKASAGSLPGQDAKNEGKPVPALVRTRASDTVVNGLRNASDNVHEDSNGGGELSAHSASASLMPRTATDSLADSSLAHTPESLTRAPSHLSTLAAKVAGAPGSGTPTLASTAVPGSSAVTLPAAKSERLLARLPNTPDDTEGPRSAAALGGKEKDDEAPLHKPTTCMCGSNGKTVHYANEAVDAVFPLSLPLLFRVVFSAPVPSDIEKTYMPASKVSKEELEKSCTKRIIEQGNSDVKTEGWVPDPSDSGQEMCIYSYEKPLGFSIGPKSTLVEDRFKITMMDFDKAIVVEQIVKTPNIPSGNAFFVKIRHCLTWTAGPSNQPPGGWSHYKMTFELEWVKSSWIKNAIEKGSVDSNKQAGELLEKYTREWIAAHPTLEVKARAGVGSAKTSSKASGSSAHHRHRKGGRKAKRDESPQGLRMEELLGDTERSQRKAELKRRKKQEAKEIALQTAASDAMDAKTLAENAAEADGAVDKREMEEWKKRAKESWAGWASYHTVYPVLKASRRASRASQKVLAGSVTGPVLVAVLVLLLLATNLWRVPVLSSSPALSRLSGGGLGAPGADADGTAFDGHASRRVRVKVASLWSGVFGSSYVHVDGMDQMRDSVDALAKQMAIINDRLLQIIDQQAQLAQPSAT